MDLQRTGHTGPGLELALGLCTQPGVVVPMVLSPIIGVIVGYLVMTTILWAFRHSHPGRTRRGRA